MAIGLCGLTEDAFARKPDQRFLFQSESFARAHKALIEAAAYGSSVIVLTGEPGAGKTTLLRFALSDLRAAGWACASAKGSVLKRLYEAGTTNALRSLADDPLSSDSPTVRSMLDARVMLIIDDADDLPDELLSNLVNERRIAGLTTASTILLAGTQILNRKLNPLLGDEANIREIWLSALSNEDVADYVRHRLRVIGRSVNEVFSRPALGLVAAYSHGVPGRINRLCASAMILSNLEQRLPIDANLLREAAIDALLITGEERPEARSEPLADSYNPTARAVVPYRLSAKEDAAGYRPTAARRLAKTLCRPLASCRALVATLSRGLFRLPRSIAGRLGMAGVGVALAASAIWLHGVGYAPVCVLDEGQVETAAAPALERNVDAAALWLPLRGDHIAQSTSPAVPPQAVIANSSSPFVSTETPPSAPPPNHNPVARQEPPVDAAERPSGGVPPSIESEQSNLKPMDAASAVNDRVSPPRPIVASPAPPTRVVPRPAPRRESVAANRPPRVVAARPQHAKRGEDAAMLTADRSSGTLNTASGWQVIRN